MEKLDTIDGHLWVALHKWPRFFWNLFKWASMFGRFLVGLVAMTYFFSSTTPMSNLTRDLIIFAFFAYMTIPFIGETLSNFRIKSDVYTKNEKKE